MRDSGLAMKIFDSLFHNVEGSVLQFRSFWVILLEKNDSWHSLLGRTGDACGLFKSLPSHDRTLYTVANSKLPGTPSALRSLTHA